MAPTPADAASPADPRPTPAPPAPRADRPGAVVVEEPAASEATAAQILALADRAHRADGHPPLNDQTRAVLARGGQRWWAVVPDPAGDDGPLGAAVLVPEGAEDGPGVVELVVDPLRRGAGIGTALADAAAAAVRSRGEEATTSVWAHGDLPGARPLARRHGLRPVRELRRLRLHLPESGPLPPALLPEQVRIRAFVPGRDEQAWLELNAAVFAHHREQGAMTRADLEDRLRQDWFDPDGLLLAEDADGTLLGFHWTKVEAPQDGREPVGEVYVLGVGPAAQGRGLGRALTLAGLHHMAGRGVETVDLYVDADNAAATALYAGLGFRTADVDVQFRR
ncbi:mycothiol synthase [Micrococcus sp.]|uniref:mycothiol synthase n=1 Tax=Micrococcus sp. TaxID=1271 RepID=UPI002A91D649|nr:mycothiol synthase [Micrococcus sp.]MDY6055618.1 mycothiol synthase [Micrococcus sp.]